MHVLIGNRNTSQYVKGVNDNRMDKGIKLLLCIIATVLIMIAERGIPVKFKRWDTLVYLIGFFCLGFITGTF